MGARRDSFEGWTYTPQTGWLRIPSAGYPADLVWPNIKPLADATYEPIIAAGTAGQYWRGDKTWQTLPGTNLGYTAATRVLTSDTGTDVTLPLFSSTDPGLTPLSGGGTSNYLRADGSWAAPPGGAGTTNLSYTAATRVIASDTGTDATLPLFSSTDPGLTPLSGGGTTNFLRADGSWAAPLGTTNLGYTAATRVLTSDTGTDVTLPLFSSTDPGLTPLSGGGTSNYLRADGSWAAPPVGAGTMAQFDTACSDGNFVYQGQALGTPASGTLTSCTGLPISTGVSGLGTGVATMLATPSMANFNTACSDGDFAYLGAANVFTTNQWLSGISPGIVFVETDQAVGSKNWMEVADGGVFQIQVRDDSNVYVSTVLSLTRAGALTVTSVAGSGASLTSLNATNLSSGTVATARLGTGTANSTTFLRGDSTWAAPVGTTNLGYTAATRVLTSDTGTDVTLPLFSSTDPGLTPLSGGGTTNFLRADGSWAAPPGGAGTTNLGYTAATRVLTSDTGTDVTLPLFSSTDPGLTPLSGGGTTNFLRADGSWAAPPTGVTSAFRATYSGSPSSGNTKVAASTETYDVAGDYDSATNYRFTPQTAGYYLIQGTVAFGTATLYSSAAVNIYVGRAGATPTSYKSGTRTDVSQAGPLVLETSDLIYLNGSNDSVELWLSTNVTGSPTHTGVFSGVFIGA